MLGQVNGKGGALTLLTLHRDAAVMIADDGLRHSQS
jgi:tetraacyldisaccharide-1-P 4'-kinase